MQTGYFTRLNSKDVQSVAGSCSKNSPSSAQIRFEEIRILNQTHTLYNVLILNCVFFGFVVGAWGWVGVGGRVGVGIRVSVKVRAWVRD